MSTTKYDRYGRPAGFYGNLSAEIEPFEINTASSTLQYVRYFIPDNPAGTGAIRRITTNESETVQQISVGWGVWGQEDQMDFYPVNSVFEVDDDTHQLVSVSPSNTPVNPPA